MRPRRIVALGLAAIFLMALAAHVALVATASPMLPLADATLAPDAASAPTDDHLDVAWAYAPWILEETSARYGRADIPTAMDFDGDRNGANDWEDLPHATLIPTLYYAYAETVTHLFLTYHVYHPRAWSPLPLGLGESHEGDGADIQVAVDKANATIVILTTQAGSVSSSYASQVGPVSNGARTLRSDFEISTGHPIVYIESGSHAIYGSHDPRAANRLARIGDPVVTYRPARPNETLAEPQAPWNDSAPYRLVSLQAFMRNATHEPGLLAGASTYHGIPFDRYHHGDRYAGPMGGDRGASPFALGFARSDAGSLFFDPAGSYQKAFDVRDDWSLAYTVAPLGR